MWGPMNKVEKEVGKIGGIEIVEVMAREAIGMGIETGKEGGDSTGADFTVGGDVSSTEEAEETGEAPGGDLFWGKRNGEIFYRFMISASHSISFCISRRLGIFISS